MNKAKVSLRRSISLALSVFVYSLSIVPTSYAGVEWTLKKELSIESAPIDIVLSPDGKWLFALASGEVLIYSTADGSIINSIAVDASFDRLSFSAADNTLLIASRSAKSLKLIQLEEVYTFSVSGLPFKGAENAPVTIAVFSDYQ